METLTIRNKNFCTMVRVFASGSGDRGSIISKTQKMVLDASLLNTQHYKGLVPHSSDKYHWVISWSRLPGSHVGRSSIHVTRPILTYTSANLLIEPRGGIPKALNLLGEARFISWWLKCLFLGEFQWSLRLFWKCRACLGYGPAPGPIFKKVLMPHSTVWWGAEQIS